MRCALFLAAWAAALAVVEPALDPWLQALYGRRRLQKKDVRLLQAKLAENYGGSQGAAYDYGGDYEHIPASSLLGRIFHKADLEYYDDEGTTLYCITVTPKPYTTQSTTPEVICFPPSRRPKTRTTTRATTTTTVAPVGNCENAQPPAHEVRTSTTTTSAPHIHYGHPSPSGKHHTSHDCSTHAHEKTHPSTHASSTRATTHKTSATTKGTTRTSTKTTTRASTPKSTSTHVPKTTTEIPAAGECGAVVLRNLATSTSRKTSTKATATTRKHVTTRKQSTAHKVETTRKHVTTHKHATTRKPITRKTTPAPKPEGCLVPPRTAPTTRRHVTPAGPKTRPPVDEFLAAWGYFKHHNSLDPGNGSHWREFHSAGVPHAPRRRDVARRNDLVVIVPPWLRMAFMMPPGGKPPAAPRLAKREEPGASVSPYQVYWFNSWPPAGKEVSRLPGREKENFVKLSSWWQDVIKAYNGHHRKKRGLARP